MLLRAVQIAGFITLGMIGTAVAQERITISSEWGSVTADLADNAATKALIPMLPLTIAMTDHLRRRRLATCHRLSPPPHGSASSRTGLSACGGLTISSSTTATDRFPSLGSSSSGK